MDNTQEYTCLSLCSGYGGLELGLRQACPNVRTIAYVEVEAFACANLVSKMEKGKLDAAPVWTDIKTFNAEMFRDRIHIITAGYNCQGESLAGKRKGCFDERWIWPHIKRIIKTVRPVWFFGENVEGHLSLGFQVVSQDLQKMGYTIEAGLFTAAEIGAPHWRKRLFVLANSGNNRLFVSKLRKTSSETGGRLDESQVKSLLFSPWPPRPCEITKIPRMVDGYSSRVDEMRLAGNGVVPQQAEKAFRYLLKENYGLLEMCK